MKNQDFEALKRLVEFASRDATAQGLEFTAYLLDLAMTSLRPGGDMAFDSAKSGAFGSTPSKLQ